MKLIKKINFMEEKKYVIGLNVAGLLLIFPFSMLFAKLTQLIFRADHYDFSGLDLAYLLVLPLSLSSSMNTSTVSSSSFLVKGRPRSSLVLKMGWPMRLVQELFTIVRTSWSLVWHLLF